MVEPLKRRLAERAGVAADTVRVIRAPYRFCPFGAHLDHQHGAVTGVAFDRALFLAFAPTEDGSVHVESDDAEGTVTFSVRHVPPARAGDWGNYVRGAALALEGRLVRGMRGLVHGEMAPGGVSSSAALGVACLLALESANDIEATPERNVDLDQYIENDYIGLQNGILDPSIILFAKRGQLVHLDTRTRDTSWTPWGSGRPPAFVAIHSGLTQALVDTRFNERVAECRQAARHLLELAGEPVPDPPRLRDVSADVMDRFAHALSDVERRRARHFFGEMDRVSRGREAWARGDAAAVGELLSETSDSSIRNYECGAPELIELVDELRAHAHVHGARFSGAGFRGYAVAFVDTEHARSVAETVTHAYAARHVELAPRVHAHVLETADGATIHS